MKIFLPGLGLLLLVTARANAMPIELTLSEVDEKDSTNSEDIQCIIYGNSCPGGQQTMSALNYAQGGNVASFDLSSAPNAAGHKEAVLQNPYTVGYLDSFVGRVFDIGIDVNTAGGQAAERLLGFEVLIDGTVEFAFFGPDFGGAAASLDPNFNGNGYFDFLLSTIDLTAFDDSASVAFHATWDQATGGAENFFVVRRSSVSLISPATAPLMSLGLALMVLARIRRVRQPAASR